MKYKTEQRDLMLDCFKNNSDRQMTVKDIQDYFEKKDSKVGLATIYRNLETLEQTGEIKKFSTEGGKKSCWQFTNGSRKCFTHYHLKCQKCGRIIHVECGFSDKFDLHILEEHEFVMDRGETVFFGSCKDCGKA